MTHDFQFIHQNLFCELRLLVTRKPPICQATSCCHIIMPISTCSFCDLVLSAPLTAAQPVLLRLQTTFSFLRYSQRSIFSPGEFLKASRPPWFEPGRQHDCCEFLRFLLDTLHEQEKTGRYALVITTWLIRSCARLCYVYFHEFRGPAWAVSS